MKYISNVDLPWLFLLVVWLLAPWNGFCFKSTLEHSYKFKVFIINENIVWEVHDWFGCGFGLFHIFFLIHSLMYILVFVLTLWLFMKDQGPILVLDFLFICFLGLLDYLYFILQLVSSLSFYFLLLHRVFISFNFFSIAYKCFHFHFDSSAFISFHSSWFNALLTNCAFFTLVIWIWIWLQCSIWNFTQSKSDSKSGEAMLFMSYGNTFGLDKHAYHYSDFLAYEHLSK